MAEEIVILSVGLTTAVGLTAPQTAASVRAGTARFTGMEMRDKNGLDVVPVDAGRGHVGRQMGGVRLPLADARSGAVGISLQLENEKGFPHQGSIDFINNQFNSSTGTLQVRGLFPNANGALIAGSFVRARPGADVVAEILNAQGAVVASRGGECEIR